MTWFDILLLCLYIPLLYMSAAAWFAFRPDQKKYTRYYYGGLTAKLFGGLGFALVYTFYYTYGGDTTTYFADALNQNHLFFDSPSQYLDYAFGDLREAEIRSEYFSRAVHHRKGTSEFFVTVFASNISLLGLGGFFTTTLLFSFFSFIGVWQMFLVFVRKYPGMERNFALAVLFIPSVFFWGSGLMKDTITIGFIGILIYALDRVKQKRGYLLVNILLFAISAYIVFRVKAYVLISFLPALLLWFFLEYRDRIQNKVMRNLSLPLFLLICIGFMSLAILKLGEISDDYSVENFFQKSKSMQTWHYQEGNNEGGHRGRGSSYSLGDYEESWTGLLQVFPAAVNVTLFRPYITEVSNPMMLLSALESLVLLLSTIFILFKIGVLRVFRFLNQDSFLMMCVIFSIFFAFAVGFTSYNFGALVRYKIPCIPFYVAALFILSKKANAIKEAKKRRRRYHKAERSASMKASY